MSMFIIKKLTVDFTEDRMQNTEFHLERVRLQEALSLTKKFLCIEIIDCNVKKFGCNEYSLSVCIGAVFFLILFTCCKGTQCYLWQCVDYEYLLTTVLYTSFEAFWFLNKTGKMVEFATKQENGISPFAQPILMLFVNKCTRSIAT